MNYEEQQQHNATALVQALGLVRPDIAQLMQVIDMTGIDPEILVQTAYALERIVGLGGTRFGHVTIQIENGIVTFIRGEASRKLNLPVIKPVVEQT